MKRLAAGNLQSIFAFFDLRPHSSEVGGDCPDAVGFFYAQFLGVPHFDSLLCEGSNGSQHRNLVDQCSGISTGNRGRFQLRALDLQRSDKLAINLVELGHGDAQVPSASEHRAIARALDSSADSG